MPKYFEESDAQLANVLADYDNALKKIKEKKLKESEIHYSVGVPINE